jgi:sensor histidine kinase YesM
MNALSLSEKTGSKEGIKNTYEGLAELENKTGNFEHAFQYYKLFTQIKDGILNEKTNKEISFLKVQYETDKKDQQINNQELRHVFLQTRIYYGLLIGFLIIVIVVVLFYLRNRRFKKEYDHSLVKLELTLLKSQLNPHFVSNSLSAIKAFIDQQPERASQFLSKFARLIRRVLEQSEHPLIALQEELKTVELYMQIESLRLDYGFDYTIRIDPGIDKTDLMVPPLILQPTIENAIWHGLAPKNSRGHILIDIKREHDLLKFTIEDNGEGQKVSKEEVINPLERKSFGLSITRKRIEILSKELKKEGYFNLTFLTGKTVAEMALPVHFH